MTDAHADAPNSTEHSAAEKAANQQQRGQVPEALKPHCFKPGQSGNPKGRKPGIPNLNSDLLKAVIAYRAGDKTFIDLILERALTEPTVMRKLMDKILENATEASPLVQFNSYEDLLERLNNEGGDGGDGEGEIE